MMLLWSNVVNKLDIEIMVCSLSALFSYLGFIYNNDDRLIVMFVNNLITSHSSDSSDCYAIYTVPWLISISTSISLCSMSIWDKKPRGDFDVNKNRPNVINMMIDDLQV